MRIGFRLFYTYLLTTLFLNEAFLKGDLILIVSDSSLVCLLVEERPLEAEAAAFMASLAASDTLTILWVRIIGVLCLVFVQIT